MRLTKRSCVESEQGDAFAKNASKMLFIKPHDHNEPYRPGRDSMEHDTREKMHCVLRQSLPVEIHVLVL